MSTMFVCVCVKSVEAPDTHTPTRTTHKDTRACMQSNYFIYHWRLLNLFLFFFIQFTAAAHECTRISRSWPHMNGIASASLVLGGVGIVIFWVIVSPSFHRLLSRWTRDMLLFFPDQMKITTITEKKDSVPLAGRFACVCVLCM